MDLNRATIIGRLVRDPELRSLTSGKSVSSFSVATGRVWKDANGQKQEQTEYHNVVVWGKLAEIASQYLRKGRQVYIEGRIQTRDWTGQDGVKRYRTEIVGDNLIMLGSAPGGAGAPGATHSAPTSAPMSAPAEVMEEEIKIEDIPF